MLLSLARPRRRTNATTDEEDYGVGVYLVCHEAHDWTQFKAQLQKLKDLLGLSSMNPIAVATSMGPALSSSSTSSSRAPSPAPLASSPSSSARRSPSKRLNNVVDSGDFLLALDNLLLLGPQNHKSLLLQSHDVMPLPEVDAFLPPSDKDALEIEEGPINVTSLAHVPWRMRQLLTRVLCVDDVLPLLLEARPHRSKWFDPHRLGQAELYDQLERVLSELKNFHPHCEPFLQRVNKKAVPDYYVVIRRPMDLGTMQKKLRDRLYRSKVEFATDLQLIYDNCFMYNTEEESPLRRSAVLLREKWSILMQRVPDIAIVLSDSLSSSSNATIVAPSQVEDSINVIDDVDEDLTQQSLPSNQDMSDGVSTDMVMSLEELRAFLATLLPRNQAVMAKAAQLTAKRDHPAEWDWLFFFNHCPDLLKLVAFSPSPSFAEKPGRHKIAVHQDFMETRERVFHVGTPHGRERKCNVASWPQFVAWHLVAQHGIEQCPLPVLKLLSHALQSVIFESLRLLREEMDMNKFDNAYDVVRGWIHRRLGLDQDTLKRWVHEQRWHWHRFAELAHWHDVAWPQQVARRMAECSAREDLAYKEVVDELDEMEEDFDDLDEYIVPESERPINSMNGTATATEITSGPESLGLPGEHAHSGTKRPRLLE